MSFFSGSEIPCFSHGPLDGNSLWVAIPVSVSVFDKHFSDALKLGKDIINRLKKKVAQESQEGCRLGFPDDQELQQKLGMVMALKKLDKSSSVQVYDHVVLVFEGNLDVWQKMEIVTHYLDLVVSFSDQFSKEKSVVFQVGERFSAK